MAVNFNCRNLKPGTQASYLLHSYNRGFGLAQAKEQVRKTFPNMTNTYAGQAWAYFTQRTSQGNEFRRVSPGAQYEGETYRLGIKFTYTNPRTGESKTFKDTIDVRGGKSKRQLQTDIRDKVREGLINVAEGSGVNSRNVDDAMGPISVETLEEC